MSDYEKVVDTILGRWKSQILYAGVKLGIFDALATPKHASEIAKKLDLDASLSYRLLRALASMGFLNEKEGQTFSITPMGELMRKRSSTNTKRCNFIGGRSRTLRHLEASGNYG